jgi:hypothetical protein
MTPEECRVRARECEEFAATALSLGHGTQCLKWPLCGAGPLRAMIVWYPNRWSTVHLSRSMNWHPKMDQSPEQLRRRAEAFRKLAIMILDSRTLRALEELAAELEARARAIEKSLSDKTDREG